MEAQHKLTLKDIYLKALARGLTAKEAGSEYGVNYISLLNRGPENGLPPLYSHWRRKDQRNLEKMTSEELLKLKQEFESWLNLVNLVIDEKQKQQGNQ
jgi:hypothetical protein